MKLKAAWKEKQEGCRPSSLIISRNIWREPSVREGQGTAANEGI